jgi:hypothetical protein
VTSEPGLTRTQIDSDAVEAPVRRGPGTVRRCWFPTLRSDIDG